MGDLSTQLRRVDFAKKPLFWQEKVLFQDPEEKLEYIVKVVEEQRLAEDEIGGLKDARCTLLTEEFLAQLWETEGFGERDGQTKPKIRKILEGEIDTTVTEEMLKVINGVKSSIDLLGDKANDNTLSIELIKEMHGMIMSEFPQTDPGCFRTIEVEPSMSATTMYARSTRVLRKLKSLITFVNGELLNARRETEPKAITRRCILIAAFFLSEFLLIHPFLDGNGRTGRILTNFIIQDVIFVPTGMQYRSNGGRQTYLRCLEDRGNAPAGSLATLMLDSVHQMAHFLRQAFL